MHTDHKMKFRVNFIKDGHPVALEGIDDDDMDVENKTVVNVRVVLLHSPSFVFQNNAN